MGRPRKSFHGFFGQQQAVCVVRRDVRGSKARGLDPSHILLLGDSGLGKTAFAGAIAKDVGGRFDILVADARVRDHGLSGRLENLHPGDIQFIDEVQELGSEDQMTLCFWMDGKKLEQAGQPIAGAAADAEARPVPRGTLIAATDRPGLLLRPFVRRFPHRVYLMPYTPEEMVLIARKRAAEMNILLSKQAIGVIARTCRGIPRLCGQRLDLLRRFWAAKGVTDFKTRYVRIFLQAHGVDENGLERIDRAYINFLAEMGDTGATLRTIAMALNMDVGYLVKFIEPLLVQLGFLQIHGQRVLTSKGIAYADGMK